MPGGKIELVGLTKRFTVVAVDGIDDALQVTGPPSAPDGCRPPAPAPAG